MASFDDDLGPMAFWMTQRAVVAQRYGLMEVLKGAKTGLVTAITSVPVPGWVGDLTLLEKIALTAATGYAGWQISKYGVCSKVGLAASHLLPGWRWLKMKMGKIEVIVDPSVRTNTVVLESRKPGSEEQTMTAPRCQCKVGVVVDSQFVILGYAIRFEGDYLISPDHVIGGEETKHILGVQGLVSLEGKERIPLATDLVAVKMTDVEMTKIGVRQCSLGSMPRAQYVSIVGPSSKGTMGNLENDTRIFGRVVYSGTTLPGYSGAAYMAGTQLLGLHQNGGMINGGYSASYAWTCLKMALKERLESSDEWLTAQYGAGKELVWQATGDPDTLQIFADGKYTAVDKSSMFKAFGDRWVNHSRISKRTLAYDDSVQFESSRMSPSVSGEGSSSKVPGGSSLLEQAQVPVPLDRQYLMSEYKKLSMQQQKAFRKSLGLQVKPVQAISGQESQSPQGN